MIKKTLLALLPLAIVAGGWYFVQSKNTKPDSVPGNTASIDNSNSTTANGNSQTDTPKNPLGTKADDTALIVESINTDSSNGHSNTDQNSALIVDSPTSNVEPSSVTVDPLSDAEIIRLERLIKNDKQLRLSLLDEFRNNSDPARGQQLAALLGPYDDPEILQVAAELAHSQNTQSRIAGLDLLSRMPPEDDKARDIAIDFLNAGESPEILVATIKVFAKPSLNASDSQRQILNNNLNSLSNHYDSTVRSQTLALMGRWDKNSVIARDALSAGLNDPDPSVRSSATFAINNISNPDEQMILSLLNIAENTEESRSTRYAALRALDNMQLSGTQIRRHADAKRSANRRN